jgi:putative effector of murein hydrolase
VGSVVASVSAVLIVKAFGLPENVVLSMVPKSVTAGVAMGIAEQIGGIPALSAVLVITTGIIGAVMATPLFNALGLKDFAARGLGIGVAAHGIGTARAFHVNALAGTYAGLAMGLNGVITALLAPWLVRALAP